MASDDSLGPDERGDRGQHDDRQCYPGEPGGDLMAVHVITHGTADLAVHRLQLAGGLGAERLSAAVGRDLGHGRRVGRDRDDLTLDLDGARWRAEGDGADMDT